VRGRVEIVSPLQQRWVAPNKQLQRTVTRRRGDGASTPLHYALAPRFQRQRAAAELRRYTQRQPR
jgi:hypothetical protein